MSAPPELLATTEQLLASCLQQISPWDPCQVPRPLFAQETHILAPCILPAPALPLAGN